MPPTYGNGENYGYQTFTLSATQTSNGAERPLEQRRTSGGKAPKSSRVRRSPSRAKIKVVPHVSLDEAVVVGGDRDVDLLALDEAMNALARLDPRKVRVVEMRFFGGLDVEETAEVLKVSPVTVKRDWRAARAWLYRELTGGMTHGLRAMETS
jgi:hypothetical protein